MSLNDFIVPNEYVLPRLCTLCVSVYQEKLNIGRLNCRLHPGIRMCDREGRIFYSCCGLYRDAHDDGRVTAHDIRGCLAIDHTDVALDDKNILARITQIKQFAIIALPRGLLDLQQSKFETPLTVNTIIPYVDRVIAEEINVVHYRFGDGLFAHIYENNRTLTATYSPSRCENLGGTSIECVFQDPNKNIDNFSLNLPDIARHINESPFAQFAGYVDNLESVKKFKQNDPNSGWPGFDQTDGILNVLKVDAPFMVVKRIGEALNIIPQCSKLYDRT